MILRVISLILLIIPVLGCDSTKEQKEAKVSGVQVKADSPRDHISVKTIEGDKSTIDVNDRTLVIALATWCPHSKNFVKTITDPRVTPAFQGYTWFFVVAENEWTSVRKQLAELKGSDALNGLSVDAALKRLKAKAGNGPLFDPSVLDSLPGKLFTLSENSPTKLDSFPSLYSHESGAFDSHPIKMVATKCSVALDVYSKYENEPEQ